MAAFATEAAVRAKFQWNDAGAVPQAVVLEAIGDAHLAVMARLDAAYGAEPAPEGLVLGETLLAGARVFDALAARSASAQRTVSVGGQRVEPGQEFAALRAAGAQAEKRAWAALAAYLAPLGAHAAGDATDTAPVLGGRE